jgi:flagellar basal-body rod modification protein FlgD
MNITPINAHASAKANDNSASGTSALPNSQGLNHMFLQLLVAQLQHQSPLEPMDPTQFVGQLAQFSELSEVTQINELLQKELASPAASHDGSSPAKSAAATAIPTTMISSAVTAAQSGFSYSSQPVSLRNYHVQGVF